jgi:LPS-assembly protein
MFNITNKWVWGWDVIAPRDRFYFQDYALAMPKQAADLLRSTPSEGISDLFISGRGDRSYFDARTMYFYGFSPVDSQGRIPVIHPVVDHNYIFANPIYGGELGVRTNLTSLSRSDPSMDPISQVAFNTGACAPTTLNPAVKNPANCLLRGVPGTYTRFSSEAHWRRTITDSYGQVFTPFASLRADVAMVSVRDGVGVSNFIPVGDSELVRVMPTVGVEYRYPFIGVQSWGTQTIEPIAQVIVRPDET